MSDNCVSRTHFPGKLTAEITIEIHDCAKEVFALKVGDKVDLRGDDGWYHTYDVKGKKPFSLT